MAATLSLPGCVRLWRSARENPPKPWEARAHCVGCALGAQRAGEAAPSPGADAVAALASICPRCERPTDRLINGRHCVSCYNREREAVRGRNAKGGRPRLCDVLHSVELAVGGPGTIRVERVDRVATRAEALALVARAAGRAIAIGPPPLRLHPLGAQLELGL